MSSPVWRRRFLFGEFELVPEERSLRRNGLEVELPAKAFEALVALVLRAPSVVTKEELMAAVWPDTAVGDGNLNTQIWTVRQALGEGRWVETVPKRGYQFVGKLELRSEDAAPSAAVTEPNSEAKPGLPAATLERPRSWKRWALAGLAVVAFVSYAEWRRSSVVNGKPSVEPLVGKYIQTAPFISEGFPPREEFVADDITHAIRLRLEYATRSWPERVFQPWAHTIRTGHVRNENGRIEVDVEILDRFSKPIWSDRYSQVYPGGEPLIGDVIGEHQARLLEQGERRTSPGNQVFDAVRDFSLKTSPQTSWKYGQARDWSGIGFRHFPYTMSGHCNAVESEDCWGGEPPPDHGIIGRSRKTGLNEFETIVQPKDALWMSTGSQFTILRWVAPADGRYFVRGRVQVADTVGRPCRVRLLRNTLDILMERRNFAGFGSTIDIDVSGLSLTQGSAVDLVFGPEIGIDYLSLAVQLAIGPAPGKS